MISPKMDVQDEETKEEAANSARGIKGDFQEEVIFLCSTDSLLDPPRV